ncbi:MAG: hypothetical protein GXO40_03510 [Epsilonproteobacteria bacterium]|nr:hypothetical protein [Campylobacterota bacterium]
MKKIEITLVGKKLKLELDDEFGDYIQHELEHISHSKEQIKELLNALLSAKYEVFKYQKIANELLEKLEATKEE